jgi:hypothetical protein
MAARDDKDQEAEHDDWARKNGGGRVSVSGHFCELLGDFCNGFPNDVRVKNQGICGSTNSNEDACCCREEGADAGSFCTRRVLAVSFLNLYDVISRLAARVYQRMGMRRQLTRVVFLLAALPHHGFFLLCRVLPGHFSMKEKSSMLQECGKRVRT